MVVIIKGGNTAESRAEYSRNRLKSMGVEEGKIQSSVTKRKGNKSTKTTFSSVDNSITRIEEVEKTPQGTATKTQYRDFNKEEEEQKRYDVIANKVISDLNESSRKQAEKQQRDNFYKFQTMQKQGLFNPTQANVISSLERNEKEKYIKNNERLDVEQGVRYAQLTGSNIQSDKLLSSYEGKKFLLNNSKGYQALIPSEEGRKAFLVGKEESENKEFKGLFDKNENNSFIDRITPNFVKNRVQNKLISYENKKEFFDTRKENKDLLKDFYNEENIKQFEANSPLNPVRSSNLGNNLFDIPVKDYDKTERQLVQESRSNIFKDIGSSFKEGFNYIKNADVSLVKDDSFDLKEGIKSSFKTGKGIKLFAPRKVVLGGSLENPPTQKELTGIKMIAYSSGSVVTNAIPVIGAVGTEVVDIGLASKDYKRGFLNPTPFNKAMGQVELVDVGADVFTGGFAPNVNTNLNTQISTNEAVMNANVKPQRGLIGFKVGTPSNNFKASEVGFGSVTNTELTFEAVKESFTTIGNSFNFVSDFNVNLPKANLNRSEVGFGLPVAEINNNVNNNVVAEVDFNNNFNNQFENQFQNDFNNQFNSNFNSNTNFNTNFNFNNNFNNQLNLNANLNFRLPRNKKVASNSFNSYTPFVKTGNLFTPINIKASSKESAFNVGAFIVENNPSDTFGISKSSFIFNGLDVKDSKGFKRKGSRRGILFEEPKSRRNNSFGEIKRLKL